MNLFIHTFIGTHWKSIKHGKELSTTKPKHRSNIQEYTVSNYNTKDASQVYVDYLRRSCVIFKCQVHTRLVENKKYTKLDH